METWMAFVSIMAIVAVVLLAGGIIAFIAHLIIGAFDRTDKIDRTVKYDTRNTELLDYATYKHSQENSAKQTNEYDFEAINKAKVEEEKSLLEEENEANFDIDEELVEKEEEIKEEIAEIKDEKVGETKIEDEDDDLDFDAMLEEISNDIIEEEKEKATEENAPKMSDELGSYSIEEYMNSLNENETEEVEEELAEPVEEKIEEVVEEIATEEDVELPLAEDEDDGEEDLEIKPEVEEDAVAEEIVEESEVEEEKVEEKEDESKKVIEELKAQLADLNKQLEIARASKTEVVTINMTEEECVARLTMLEERLKDVKKDYKTNMKEYRPLKKVMNDLEKYQTKLRRKDTIVAKKKVALYGVNNYVDIDKEKAEKLANDLELLEGLRLSVSHCEEVINANKDRYPILERTNQILEDQIAHIEADIASTQATLAKIREQNGEGEGENA